MQYGVAFLSVSALRESPSDTAEQVTQVLYGELFKVVEVRKKWSRIRLYLDKYDGWLDNKQYQFIEEEDYKRLILEKPKLVSDLVDFVQLPNKQLLPITMGSSLNSIMLLGHTFEGNAISKRLPKANLIETALNYLNTPYQWGGKTPFGIDCSGFTQMVYLLNGHILKRDASLQANQGDALSFIEESTPGDLAFFDDNEGNINHVGIIMKDHYIIHAHGHVRIDQLDQSGIFNVEKKAHTHKLRVIKRVVKR